MIQRSPSRRSAPSCTSMRTSSPTKSGLPSLVASTRPATAAGSSSAPITFAASRVAAPASRPPSVTTSATSAARRRERRARVAQLGPRRHEHEQRHAGAPLHEVLDEVEQQRLRPLEVVDHEHDGPHRRERGEQAPHGEEGLLGRAPARPRAARRCPPRCARARLRRRARPRRSPRAARRRRRRPRCGGARAAPRRAARTWRRRPRRSARRARSRARRARRANSASSRDLPSPGEPSTTASRAPARRDRGVVDRERAAAAPRRARRTASPTRPPGRSSETTR